MSKMNNEKLLVQILLLAYVFVLLISYALNVFGFFETSYLNSNLINLFIIGFNFIFVYFYIVGNKSNFFSPIIIFIMAITLYFGIGPLIYSFGNESSISWINNRSYVSEIELFRVNSLVIVGFIFTLCGFLLAKYNSKNNTISTMVYNGKGYTMKNVTQALLIVSLPIRYLLIVPYDLKIFNFIIPGALYSFTNLLYIAIILMSYLSYTKGYFKKTLFIIMISELFLGFLILSKLVILMPVLAFFIGRVLAKQNIKTMVVGSLAILIAFFVLTPLILSARSGESFSTDNIISSIFTEENNSQYDNEQWGWIRINYAPAQNKAIELYNQDQKGQSILEPLPWLLIPRLIYPNKPIFDISTQFSVIMSGNENNQDGPGAYADIYWNFGWIGVVLLSTYIGFLIGKVQRMYEIIRHNQVWAYLPFVYLFTILISRGVNNYFIKAYVMDLIFIILQTIIILIILRLLFSKKKGLVK